MWILDAFLMHDKIFISFRCELYFLLLFLILLTLVSIKDGKLKINNMYLIAFVSSNQISLSI